MKKILFSLIAMSLFATTIISCQSNQKGTAESDTSSVKVDTSSSVAIAGNTVSVQDNITKITPTSKIEKPIFSNEEINNSFAEFPALKEEYIAALKSKDDAKIKEVTDKYKTWVLTASTFGNRLAAEENQIYINYYTRLVVQWGKITEQYKGQAPKK